jgi:translation initiation factor 3 subunit A
MALFLYLIPYLAKWYLRIQILIHPYYWYIDAEEERRKREEAERKANLDAIAEKQRLREIELEEKAKANREKLLKGSEAGAAPSSNKYIPKFKRQDGLPARQDAPPPRQDGPPPSTDRWRPSRYSSTSSSTWGRAHNWSFFFILLTTFIILELVS